MISLSLGKAKTKSHNNTDGTAHKYMSEVAQYAPFVKQLQISAQIIVQDLMNGPYQQRRAGDGSRFWQHSPYQHGDPLKQIDWKASAKHGSPLILQREAEQTQSFLMYCPYHSGMDYTPQSDWIGDLSKMAKQSLKRDERSLNSDLLNNKFSAALMLSACLMHIFKKQRHPFAVSTKSSQKRTGLTDDFIQEQLTLLCSADNQNNTLVKDVARKHVLWIDDFWSDLGEIERRLIDMRNQNGVPYLLQIITSDELSLPFEGHVRFAGGEAVEADEDIADIPMVKVIRKEYQKRIKTHLDSLQHICNKQGVFYSCFVMGKGHHNDLIDDYLNGNGYKDLTRFLENMIYRISNTQSGMMS